MAAVGDFFELLNSLTVDCKDDGESFIVRDRIDVIEGLLKSSSYTLVAREPLALIYAKKELKKGDSVLLVSSHVDCVYERCFCCDEGALLRGTFDNSFGNAAVLWNMLCDNLPQNVVIAFTGDEEKNSEGAAQALLALGKMGCVVSFAIVQDITNEGWDSGALFTIENDCGIDILTAYGIVSSLEQYSGCFAFAHDAEPDESWCYAEYGVPCLTLCVPSGGELHDNKGVFIRKKSALEYCNALRMLTGFLAG